MVSAVGLQRQSALANVREAHAHAHAHAHADGARVVNGVDPVAARDCACVSFCFHGSFLAASLTGFAATSPPSRHSAAVPGLRSVAVRSATAGATCSYIIGFV